MALDSSVLAWKMPWTEEPDGLPSMGSHRVGHDWSDLAAAAAAEIHGKNKSVCETVRKEKEIPHSHNFYYNILL